MSLAKYSLLCVLLLGAVLMVGCKKEPPISKAETMVSSTQDVANLPPAGFQGGRPPSTAAAAPVVVPESADVNATLTALSLELRKYVVRTRTVPRTFEEFVTKSQAQIPPPPPGKKYAIEGQAVVLKKL